MNRSLSLVCMAFALWEIAHSCSTVPRCLADCTGPTYIGTVLWLQTLDVRPTTQQLLPFGGNIHSLLPLLKPTPLWPMSSACSWEPLGKYTAWYPSGLDLTFVSRGGDSSTGIDCEDNSPDFPSNKLEPEHANFPNPKLEHKLSMPKDLMTQQR